MANEVTWHLPERPDGRLSVSVSSTDADAELLINVLGNPTSIDGTVLRVNGSYVFDPTMQFDRGVDFVATLIQGTVLHRQEFALPMDQGEPPTVLTVYPSGASIPENLLRFYIEFSEPMARGNAYPSIQLLGANGKQIEAPLLNLRRELWDSEQRRLTVLLDPGRVKRGVGPNLQHGRPLTAGDTIRLIVTPDIKSADGQLLTQAYEKRFRVAEARTDAIDPTQWYIDLPEPRTSQPLRLRFQRSLDAALLQHSLSVQDANGKPIEGTIRIRKNESVWEFIPAADWRAGDHWLEVANRLEDVAGNKIGAALDVAGRTSLVTTALPVPRIRLAIPGIETSAEDLLGATSNR